MYPGGYGGYASLCTRVPWWMYYLVYIAGIPGWVYYLVYMAQYTTLGTPRLHPVWHGQRTRRHTAAGDKTLGSTREIPLGESLFDTSGC